MHIFADEYFCNRSNSEITQTKKKIQGQQLLNNLFSNGKIHYAHLGKIEHGHLCLLLNIFMKFC